MHNNILNEDDLKEDDKVWGWIKKNYPQIKLERSGNIGFGSAHNEMIRKMKGDYYLCCNPDILLEPDFLEKLINFINKTKEDNVGVVGGKLLYWDFAKRDSGTQGKTNRIDSLGLKIKKTHRVVDMGQGEVIRNEKLETKNDNIDEVFGLSGALFLASRQALEMVAYPATAGDALYKLSITKTPLIPLVRGEYKEYFDETIFMYKEDVDLAYRLRLAGIRTFIVNDAIAYHDRSIVGNSGIIGSRKGKMRKIKNQTVNTWSFLHHHILLYKNWQWRLGWKIWLSTFCYELCSNVYLLLFEFSTFWNGWKLFFQKFSEINKRKKATIKRDSANKIKKWMHKNV